MRERRRYPRVRVNLAATVYLKEGPPIPCEILNLSEGGALLRCSTPIAAIGEVLLVEMNYKEAPIRFKGRISERDQVELELSEDEPEKSIIRWTDGASGAFGVQFLDVSPERKIFLHRLVHYFAEKYGFIEEN